MGIQAGIGDLSVSKSGESIYFLPRDPQGQPLLVSGVRSSDDIQLLHLTAVTQASTCTLTFDGATTAPIPLQTLPPQTSFVWKATLPRPGSYNLGLAWGVFYGGPPGLKGTTSGLMEVFSGGVSLGSMTLDQSHDPDPSTGDLAVPGVGIFWPLGTFNFAGTDLLVRLSGPAGSGLLLAGALRVAPVGFTDPATVGYIDPDPYRLSGSDGALEGVALTSEYGNWTSTSIYTPVGGPHIGYYATATGTQVAKFPTVADVQTALAGLPNVLPGSLIVTSPSNQAILVQFTGAMGGQPLPTLTCSDAAFQVVHDGTSGSSIGGDFPTVTVNGVAHDLAASSFAPGTSPMAFHLLQDTPSPLYQRYGEGLFQVANYNPYAIQEGAGYGGRVAIAPQTGPLATWTFQGLAGPAEFQVDITWPSGDPSADILECDVLDGTGRVLATVAGIDQSKAPGDSVDATGAAWKTLGRFKFELRLNTLVVRAQGPGNPGKHVLLDTVRLTRVSPDQGVKIRPGDSVLFHMPTDYVRTSTGSVASVSGVPVAPAPATRLPVVPATPKTLQLGYNCDSPLDYGIDSCFANYAIQVRQPFALAQDAAGNPTRLNFDHDFGCGRTETYLNVYVGDSGGNGYGVPSCGPGVWMLRWTGPAYSLCQLVSFVAWTTVEEITSRRTTDGLVNTRYYQISTTSPSSPCLLLRILSTQSNGDGTCACDVSNVTVYPPDVDPNSTSRWRPGFLKKLQGMQCFRFMDMLGTNNTNLSKFAHFPDQANFPMGYRGRSISIPIASIGPPTPDPFCENVAGTVVRVTTKVPHGLDNGFIVGLQTTDGTSIGQVAGNTVDLTTRATTSTPRDPIDPTDIPPYQTKRALCHVIDDYTVQLGIQVYSGPLARMTNTLTPANGVLYADLAPGAMMGPADMADLCVEAGLEPWVNVPWLATDDCVRQMAQVLAEKLPAGRKVHIEYGNEPWNGSFVGNSYCTLMATLLGLPAGDYTAYYMTRMGQVHSIFRDVWAAQGRIPADVRRVCGVWQNSPPLSTTPSLAFAVAHGISFDELAPACYYENVPAAGPLDDLLSREQLFDLLAMNLQQSDLPALLAAHLQACRDALAHNPAATWLGDVVLVNYEGGPGNLVTTSMTANVATMNHVLHRHPDFCEIEMNHLQMLEDAGVKLYNAFTLYGVRSSYQWGVYESYQMEAGTGDATIDVANVNDFNNLQTIKSEAAAAMMKWSGMIQQQSQPTQPTQPVQPPTQPTKPARPVLRNGQLLGYGGNAY